MENLKLSSAFASNQLRQTVINKPPRRDLASFRIPSNSSETEILILAVFHRSGTELSTEELTEKINTLTAAVALSVVEDISADQSLLELPEKRLKREIQRQYDRKIEDYANGLWTPKPPTQSTSLAPSP